MSDPPDPIDEEITKFPDEDKIEDIEQQLFDLAWNKSQLTAESLSETITGIMEVLRIFNKILASERLSEIIQSFYMNSLTAEGNHAEVIQSLRKIDLILCFFHHYIYAFDEFMNRKFRNSVIRSGLMCERIVKRLALAAKHADMLEQMKFEDRVNKIRSELEGDFPEIIDLATFVQYAYRQRTIKGAHDTKAANAIIAQNCINAAPNIYFLYLQTLNYLGEAIEPEEELTELVNSTITIGTRLVLGQQGHSIKSKQVLEALYQDRYFSLPKALADVQDHLSKLGYNFPKTTLFQVLNSMSAREGMLSKDKGKYVQRSPPEQFYRKDIIN